MKSFLLLLLALLVTLATVGGCANAVEPAPTSTPKTSATTAPAGQQQQWDSILAEAKKEGAVTIYSSWSSAMRAELGRAFKEKYGIGLEFTTLSRGGEIYAKVQAEKRAGLHAVDVMGAGNQTLLGFMKPEGLLGPIEPLLILPEVKDANAWKGGKIPFTDKDGMALSMIGLILRNVVYNTDVVKDGEITSFKDLLKPQYKDKIISNDPSMTGAFNSVITHLGYNLWGEAETVDFLKKLVKDQHMVIQRDNRILVESVARGKYAIGLAPMQQMVAEFLSAGAPLKLAKVKEENYLAASAGTIGVPTKFAHPNATIIFVNWLLTKEGQSLFATSFGSPSMRTDASTEGIDPLFIPVPGEKYYLEVEELTPVYGKWLELARAAMTEVK